MDALHLRPLHPDDAPEVTRWLRDYLARHRTWWQDAWGRAPEAPLERLVERDWRDLLAAGDDPSAAEDARASRWVRIAADASGAPLGVARAEVRPDPYMGYPIGTLQWIYVARDARGRGAGDALMDAASDWMERTGACGRQLFVTAANEPALALYRRHGYRVIDHRMLAP